MTAKRITSWERRRRRRVRITVLVSVGILLLAAAALLFMLTLPYETWDLSEFYNITYSGFNTEGKIITDRNNTLLDEATETLKNDYKDSPFHLKTCSDQDFDTFKNSIDINISATEHLSNGSRVKITYIWDKDLADKLKVNIINENTEITVSGLDNAIRLSKDDLFRDIDISFMGISPDVSMVITNNSSNPFLQSIVYNPLDPRERYANGDIVTIRAFYSTAEATKQHYIVDTPSEECLLTVTVSSKSAYISDESQLPESVLDEAIASGLGAFVDANEYGVRIFCEAHLVPVYINKQATFEWVKPSFRSAYLKCVRDEYAGENGYHYNDLDIIYSVAITQANGVSCPCYAVVRFSDLIINEDGSIDYDFSNPVIMSSDYKLDSVHKTVATSFEGTHTVTKISGR